VPLDREVAVEAAGAVEIQEAPTALRHQADRPINTCCLSGLSDTTITVFPRSADPLIFFSSDATALYKGDNFRCLALPEGHTIQFRYKKQWVHPQILKAPNKAKDRFGLIIFVGGNNQSIEPNLRRLTYEPLRFCTVKDAFFDYDTEQLLVILELEQFVKCQHSVAQGPPDLFVTPGTIADYEPTNWLECVRRLRQYYTDTLFFRLNRVLLGTDLVSPIYLSDLRMSRFDLLEETGYSLECLYYHPSGAGDIPLTIKSDSEQLEIINTFASGAGAELDKRLIPLQTKLLENRSAGAFITFSSCADGTCVDPNYVQVLWKIRRKRSKAWIFTGCVLLGACGLGFVQIGTKFSAWWASVLLVLIGGSFVAASAGLLYRYFNKT
jgi:hypothetical protein